LTLHPKGYGTLRNLRYLQAKRKHTICVGLTQLLRSFGAK